MRRLMAPAMLLLVLALPGTAQETGGLRVTVVLTDADGNATPIPRVVLLISDNPATAEPRRVRTGADGAVELKLAPGNYTVESDRPVTLGPHAYVWTQMIDVAPGRDTALALTPENAEVEAVSDSTAGGAPVIRGDTAAIFNKWQRSIVEIWTPTTHASGFLIDARGLVATNDRAIGDATAVAVEISNPAAPKPQAPGPRTLKVPGRVVAADRLRGVALVWIDPATVASLTPMPSPCPAAPAAPVEYEDGIVTIAAPMLSPKEVIPGTVGRVEEHSFEVDWNLADGSAGGPVFASDGRAIGIAVAPEGERHERRRADSRVVPLGNVCNALAAAEKAMAGAAPPAATLLPVEAARPVPMIRKPVDPKAPRLQPPVIASSNFDLTLLTPAMLRGEPAMSSPRTDFGNWTDYVAAEPAVLLVRVTPQFEESFWKTLARGAAQTQGVALPPLRSFSANFQRMRAYCGNEEVAPIHPFSIERRVADGATIREGLYVFALTDFGPQCGTVRFDLYSEKSPGKADTRTIDPALFEKLATSAR